MTSGNTAALLAVTVICPYCNESFTYTRSGRRRRVYCDACRLIRKRKQAIESVYRHRASANYVPHRKRVGPKPCRAPGCKNYCATANQWYCPTCRISYMSSNDVRGRQALATRRQRAHYEADIQGDFVPPRVTFRDLSEASIEKFIRLIHDITQRGYLYSGFRLRSANEV